MIEYFYACHGISKRHNTWGLTSAELCVCRLEIIDLLIKFMVVRPRLNTPKVKIRTCWKKKGPNIGDKNGKKKKNPYKDSGP